MKDISEAPADIEIDAKKLEANVHEILQQVSRAIHAELVDLTPVDTGRARSNWIVTQNEPANFGILPYHPGFQLGRGETANKTAAIMQGIVATNDVSARTQVWITNNVIYIGELNDGYSRQTPAGFVELGIAKGVLVGGKLNVL